MDIDKIIIGLLFLLGGAVGNVWRRSAMDKKNNGMDYSTMRIIYSSWGLIVIGAVLIILSPLLVLREGNEGGSPTKELITEHE